LYRFQRIWRHLSTTPSGTFGGLYKMVGNDESGSVGFSLLNRFSFCGVPFAATCCARVAVSFRAISAQSCVARSLRPLSRPELRFPRHPVSAAPPAPGELARLRLQ